ncbi:MAG TPA: sigma-54 dependent transcriptional regulator [Terriglobales bacterium]|nr:sigma-54 dependent transcriptional regulator [Terriglobales bacterium]
MICHFVDSRTDFVNILAEKLGPDFTLEPASPDDRKQLTSCDVIVVALPSQEHPDYASCLSRLQLIARNPMGVPVVASLASPERQLALTAMMAGAYDHFFEIGSMDELRVVLRRAAQFYEMNRELQRLRVSGLELSDFVSIIGCDAKMRAIFSFASKVASTDATVLLTGETGTGKEVLAKAIHEASPRSRQPFVAVACSSLPETLIEAELFGHEKGAFTGATAARRGRFEAAERGTIFLDEIGELSPGLQVKLLRVLQERTFERLGSNQPRQIEARVICATNRNLSELVKPGLFRADLYYRLNTIELNLPPLRERRDDVALLAHSFLQSYAQKHKRAVTRISRAAMAALQEYDWPGNVRELQNVIERAVVISDGPEIVMEQLPSQFAAWDMDNESCSFEDEVRGFKKRLIQRTLTDTNNNKLQAARTLKIARSSLHRLIEELQIENPERKTAA